MARYQLSGEGNNADSLEARHAEARSSFLPQVYFSDWVVGRPLLARVMISRGSLVGPQTTQLLVASVRTRNLYRAAELSEQC